MAEFIKIQVLQTFAETVICAQEEKACGSRSEFSYELHQGIRKVTDKIEDSIKDTTLVNADIGTLKKVVRAFQSDISSLNRVVQDVILKMGESSSAVGEH